MEAPNQTQIRSFVPNKKPFQSCEQAECLDRCISNSQKMLFAHFVENFSSSTDFKILEMLRSPDKLSLKLLKKGPFDQSAVFQALFGPMSWRLSSRCLTAHISFTCLFFKRIIQKPKGHFSKWPNGLPHLHQVLALIYFLINYLQKIRPRKKWTFLNWLIIHPI